MKNSKIVKIGYGFLEFDNGIQLYSFHNQDGCENHYLMFGNLNIKDLEELEFDFSNDNFFERIEGYGITLKATNGTSIKIPGYGINNGDWSSNLYLIASDHKHFGKIYDISMCQDYYCY